ncbi:MAG: PLP-dependent transferase, partial [Pseudomonadota bacterium]
MKPETIAIHAPERRRDGAVAPPIHLSTTFEHGPGNESLHGREYRRDSNPNVDDLEHRLAALEGGVGAVAFGSGMAAGAALMQSLPRGATIVFHRDLYFAFRKLATTILPEQGVRARFVDLGDADGLGAAVAGADLVWFETPSNPRLE